MTLAVSIVSHGHGPHVRALLALLALPGATTVQRVWLTLNVPEPELAALAGQPWPFALHILANSLPLGFGANHNQAFAHEQGQPRPARWFVVLNPDMTWAADPFPALLAAAQTPDAGCAYPLQLDPQGRIQDHRRTLPTPAALWQRHTRRGSGAREPRTEWVNAAFLLLPCEAYAAVEGFDTAYFMYCEDVDLCLRLQLAGYRLVEAPQARVVHDAHRASRRSLRHLVWHLRSLWRLWHSTPYQRFLAQRRPVTIQG